MERAASISDEALRHKFLENVKTNREILTAWEAREKALWKPKFVSDTKAPG
jgi:hypothetical protein